VRAPDLRSGPVFRANQIRRYLYRRKKYMKNVIATINLKGGVGKTTTTAALAEFMSAVFGKKVLVIDLDPQTNLTTVLIGEDRWKKLNDAGYTLHALFEDALYEDASKFDLEKSLQRGVSPVGEVRTVDLLPSSLDLIDVQDRLASMSPGKYYTRNPTEILKRAVKNIIPDYDYVLIDCPPNLGLITLNGLRIADGYIIPTIPDVLSTYGIPQIQKRVGNFAADLAEEIIEVGIIVTKFRTQAALHHDTIRRLEDDENLPLVFETKIPEAARTAESAEHVGRSTLRQKYGPQFDVFRDLAAEFIETVEANA
jgi:chromosome partitioning protein